MKNGFKKILILIFLLICLVIPYEQVSVSAQPELSSLDRFLEFSEEIKALTCDDEPLSTCSVSLEIDSDIQNIDDTAYISAELFAQKTGDTFSAETDQLTLISKTNTITLRNNDCNIYSSDDVEVMDNKVLELDNSWLFPIEGVSKSLGYYTQYTDTGINLNRIFQTKRLIIKSLYPINTLNAIGIADGYDNLYVLEFKTESDTLNAYEYYKNLEIVDHVLIDSIITVSDTTTSSITSSTTAYKSWGGTHIGADAYTKYLKSFGPTLREPIVAVLDTGIDTDHYWLDNRIISDHGKNFSSTPGDTVPYEDVDGHGTHVSGIIADLTPDNVKILPIKILNDDGSASTAQVFQGIMYVNELKKTTKLNIVAMNMSFGFPSQLLSSDEENLFKTYVSEAYDLGIMPVAAAGNKIENNPLYSHGDVQYSCPANIEKALTVSSIGYDDNHGYHLSSFSFRGKYIDLCAPGEDIVSAKVGGGTISLSGTSMAAPHVTAAVALLCSNPYNKSCTSEYIENILKATAVDFYYDNDSIGWDPYWGAGLVNLKMAYFQFLENLEPSYSKEYNQELTLSVSTNYTNTTYTWYKNNQLVETNNTGLLTIQANDNVPANYFVMAQLSNGETIYSNSCSVDTLIPMTTGVSKNGRITSNNATMIKYGENFTYYFTANQGYELFSVTVDGNKIIDNTIKDIEANGYTFTNITSPHTISAEFRLKTYNVTIGTLDHCEISLSSSSITHGDSLSFSITTDIGYEITDVKINGVTIGTPNTYTIDNVTEDIQIDIDVEYQRFFSITASSSENGTISPIGNTIIYYGDDTKYTFTANTGYVIKDVIIDEVSYGKLSEYTFTNVSANHTIHVEFERIILSINISCSENGTVSPKGKVNIEYGENLIIDIDPNKDYGISYISIDNEKVEVSNNINLTNITKDTDIYVKFGKIFKIVSETDNNGSITASCDIVEGHDIVFKFTPKTGYRVKMLVIDNVGIDIGSSDHYTFKNVTESHRIEVRYEPKKYNIIIAKTGNGKIVCTDNNSIAEANYGESRTFEFKGESGWEISKVLINHKEYEVLDGRVTIENIDRDLNIELIFVEKETTWFEQNKNFLIIIISSVVVSLIIIILIFKIANKKQEKKQIEALKERSKYTQQIKYLTSDRINEIYNNIRKRPNHEHNPYRNPNDNKK